MYVAGYGFDLGDFDPAVIETYRTEGQGLVGLPLQAWPFVLYYNRDLFDQAGLPYPPQEFGALYEGRPWDLDALADLGMRLTLDAKGNDATSARFDMQLTPQLPASLVQPLQAKAGLASARRDALAIVRD